MPQKAWGEKRERQYEKVKSGLKKRGRGEDGQQGTRPAGRVPPTQQDLDAGRLAGSPPGQAALGR